jgi:hypothetical protein
MSGSSYQDDIARALKSNAEIKELLSKPRTSLGKPANAQAASPTPSAQMQQVKSIPVMTSIDESEAVNQLKSTIEGLLRDLGRALMEKQKVEVRYFLRLSAARRMDMSFLIFPCPCTA